MFRLTSRFTPTGDQPEAIAALKEGILSGADAQVLLGVTGSGKTFTIANLIQEVQRPTLILSHNKTLAAQLYGEFKSFFPDNAVEYFISYYDYYQPEAYLPLTNTYIEKDLSINDEIDKMRLRTTASLLSGRRDIIVVSSVSCLYSMANPEAYSQNIVHLDKGMTLPRQELLHRLVDALYSHNEVNFERGSFRAKGDTVDVFPAVESFDGVAYRIRFWDDEIEQLSSFDPATGDTISELETLNIYPANLFVTDKSTVEAAIAQIEKDLVLQTAFLKSCGKEDEAMRLEERTNYDLEMIRELGYCTGIENYSRYFDGRQPGQRPFCLMDYFPKDFLLIVDESHVTIPQVHAMAGGDNSRKRNLVEYGFRLPSAYDNRPLSFEEFESLTGQTVYVSATPSDYEMQRSEGVIVEQLLRPTGILDPEIEVVPRTHQIDRLVAEIRECTAKKERVLVTTLTKKMAEELSSFLDRIRIKCQYIHSDVETFERVEILDNLRCGKIDVLIGVNLLREGLDLPEVSLVAILDADKEGFLRNTRSLIQTAGRAARHPNGKVLMFADSVTHSMQECIDATRYRREKQAEYNTLHHIIPTQIVKTGVSISDNKSIPYIEEEQTTQAADPLLPYLDKTQLEKLIRQTKAAMQKAAKESDFMEAARLRDEMFRLEKQLNSNQNN